MAAKGKVTSHSVLQRLGNDDSLDSDSQDSLLAYESEPHNEPSQILQLKLQNKHQTMMVQASQQPTYTSQQ